MTTAWDAWPSTPPSMSPLSRSPRSPAVVAFTPGGMMSFSPRASFDRSWALTARLSPPSVNVPTLPPEIIRRIIRHALALPPTAPPRIRRDAKTGAPVNAPTPDWDMYAGKARARARHGEAAARESVMRTARTLLHVCRAWKLLVTKYLYAEPHITPNNVVALAHAVEAGDRKWSDLCLHPHSYPGRWLTVLDLSHIGLGGYYGADAISMSRALSALLELSPSVTHLRLPPHGVRLDDLRVAPCMRRLKALEGVHLGPGAGSEEDAIKVLRAAKALEILGLVWVGSVPTTPPNELDLDALSLDNPPPPRRDLELPRLHTLYLVGGRAGPLLAALTRADLPSLVRLVTSPYETSLSAFDDDPERGGPRALQVAHGPKILSLTYVSANDWPRSDLLPPPDTLALHPALVHLHLSLPHSLLNDSPHLATALANPHHPLEAITVPRWPRVVAGAEMSPHPATPSPTESGGPPAPNGNHFLAALCARKSRIKTVSVEGFTWVAPALGRFAAESGDSGMMRQWATWLGRAGVELRDSEGNTAPVIERGREQRGGPWGGRRSVDGGRRPSFGW